MFFQKKIFPLEGHLINTNTLFFFRSIWTYIILYSISIVFLSCSNSEFTANAEDYISDDELKNILNNLEFQDSISSAFHPSGFYTEAFTIIIPINRPINCEIGGPSPSYDSPTFEKIAIDTTTTIRCAFFNGKHKLAPEIIRTYIFEKKPTIPAIFITTNPNSLFDPDTGIYMEGPYAQKKEPHYGANYWRDTEIPIFLELVEVGMKDPAFSKHAGLKIFGNLSRVHPKKSVSITFKDKYGDKRLNYSLFPDFPNLSRFKSFILRNFGNSFGKDYIRDRLSSSLSEGLGVDYQRGRFVLVYYNGHYFGIHDLRERSNEYYFETHYGIKHDNINLLKADNSISSGSSDGYKSLIKWISENDLENDKNYAHVASIIDINNFINYMQVEIFANNRDWPGNNLKKWNQINPQTPWKWFLYDLDFGFWKSNISKNIFYFLDSEKEINYANAPEHTFLFRSLLKNKEFKAAFINRMATLLQMNFNSSRILDLIENMMKEIELEIPQDQARWSLNSSKMDEQLRSIQQFAEKRALYITTHLQEYFKLETTIPVKLSVQGEGSLLVHGLPLDKTHLTIHFFKNFPVKITASPKKGSIWSHWNDGKKEMTRTILPGKDNNLVAIFK